MASSNKKNVTYRFPPSLINDLKIHCNERIMKESDFVRDAVKEKLIRSSIEENLRVNVDTNHIENTLTKYIGLLENKINQFDDLARNLSVDMNKKFNEVNKNLELIMNKLYFPDKLSILNEPSLEDTLLNLLPAKKDDLYIELGSIDETKSIIKILQANNKVKINKKTGLVTKIDQS